MRLSRIARAMTLELRPAAKVGREDHGWLKTSHHFSFADYYDPKRMGWGDLIVWNDGTVQGESGFPFHPHRDMEIVTYVFQGIMTHQDRHGNYGKMEAGDVQVMSAGTGVVHSEFNKEPEQAAAFQIWILPNKKNLKPSWGIRKFPKNDRAGKFVTLASGFEKDQEEQNALPINTESRLVGATLRKGQATTYHVGKDRVAYFVPTTGKVEVNGVKVSAHDGLAVRDVDDLHFTALEDVEIVMVDTIDSKRGRHY